MTATPHTVITATATAVFARKDRAVAYGESLGESFTVTSPKGKIIYSYTAPVATQEEISPEAQAVLDSLTVPAVATVTVTEDAVKFHTASGRNIPVLEAGSTQRAIAEAIAESRAQGATVQQAADAQHISKATARRLINALALTLEVEALALPTSTQASA